MNQLASWILTTLLLGSTIQLRLEAATISPSWNRPPHQQREGVFWRVHWFERTLTSPALGYTRRPRINAPNAVLDPRWGVRSETRENGLLLIQTEEDLFQIQASELYAELWGGHPGTANKRFTINGRSTYQIPRNGTEDGNCTYSYPVVPLLPTDVVNGFNAIQWNVDPGTTFWGHAFVNQACIRMALTNHHSDLVLQKLDNFDATVSTDIQSEKESIRLSLQGSTEMFPRIEKVIYQGWYRGYDDNGNLNREDWHGFTKDREPTGFIGASDKPPFDIHWDTRLLPAQKNVAVRAMVTFKDVENTVYLTAAYNGLTIADRKDAAVHLYSPIDLPSSFWSRDNREKNCTIMLDESPEQIEKAELYVITWTGGPGEVMDYFTLNGHHYPVAEGHAHEIQYNRLSIDPKILKQGVNTFRLLSDTEHHGIEIIYPGPALMVRTRLE